MLGDIIGTPGINEIMIKLNGFKKKEKVNLVIANGENACDGFGITALNIKSIKEAGVDVITSGNHIWSKEDADELLSNYDYLLRPANYPRASGKGYWIGEINGINTAVVNLLGRYQLAVIDCPFQTLNKLLKTELKNCQIVIVDFHAENPAEKKALAYEFDGKISLLAGTHTHVQTADEMILPNGSGFITDIGLCGSIDSIIGMKKEEVIEKMVNQYVVPYEPSTENTKMQGIIASIDIKTKKTINIKRISI
jgi:metallophosphoesterase (TIGR00282 family)